ncbi:MAG: DNA translocase FtsK, partial [Candidatus Aureabacteria bacterium]|nr:DNA translocase FtsK [Candidatus Auribacterota bacterium]
AFRVSAKVDSRTVLDTIGAEKLLGYGDMLFLSPQSSDLVRIQGAYLDDDEIRKAVEYWESQGEPEYDPITLNALEGPIEFEGEEDPLFKEAVEFIRETQQASTSLLQRKFKIGYNRASRLMEELEAKAVIGPAVTGGKTREIYVEKDSAPSNE